jgi:hypothetical protein
MLITRLSQVASARIRALDATQPEIAEKIGVKLWTLVAWLRGQAIGPNRQRAIDKLAMLLGLPANRVAIETPRFPFNVADVAIQPLAADIAADAALEVDMISDRGEIPIYTSLPAAWVDDFDDAIEQFGLRTRQEGLKYAIRGFIAKGKQRSREAAKAETAAEREGHVRTTYDRVTLG